MNAKPREHSDGSSYRYGPSTFMLSFLIVFAIAVGGYMQDTADAFTQELEASAPIESRAYAVGLWQRKGYHLRDAV